jgi:hypothetical protein
MPPRQQRCKLTSEDQLTHQSAFDSEISSQCTAELELIVLHLLDDYDFDLDDLGHILLGLYFSLKPFSELMCYPCRKRSEH